MSLIPIEVAMQHVYADEADQDQVERKLASAIETAEQFMGRRVFANGADLLAAQLQAGNDIKNLSNVSQLDNDNETLAQLKQEINDSILYQSKMAMRGEVINPAIEAGILLIFGDLYANRENSVDGKVVELPMAAKHYLQPFRIMGV